MTRVEWIEEMIKKEDTTQLVMFFENLIWSATEHRLPDTESIKKYLFSEEGYSLNDMYNNR